MTREKQQQQCVTYTEEVVETAAPGCFSAQKHRQTTTNIISQQ